MKGRKRKGEMRQGKNFNGRITEKNNCKSWGGIKDSKRN